MRYFLIIVLGAFLAFMPAQSAAKDKKMSPAEVVEAADVAVGLNGLVCDFCSIALNKTFKKRPEVLAISVDLESKTLSLVLKAGAKLTNDDIVKLVQRAGYTATKIARKDGPDFMPAPKP